MKIQNLIIWVFSIIFIGCCYFLFSSYQNKQQATVAAHSIEHTFTVIEKIDNVETAVFELESKVRGYMLSGDSRFLSTLDQRKQEIRSGLYKIRLLTADNPFQQKHSKILNELLNKKIAFQYELLSIYNRNSSEAERLIAKGKGKELADAIKIELQIMRGEERALLELRSNNNYNLTEKRFISSIIGVISVLLLFALCLLLIAHKDKLRQKAESETTATETKYRNLIDNAAVVVYTVNVKGQFDFISNKCESLTGYHSSELLGQYFNHIVADEWKERTTSFYLKQFQQRTPETFFCFPILTKEKEERWVEQTAVLLHEEKTFLGFQCIVKDITDKKKTEALLIKAEGQIKAKQEEYQFRMQAILDHIPMIVYLKDLQGRYLMVNKYFKAAFDISEQQVLGKTAHEVNSYDIAERHHKLDGEVMLALQPLEREELVITKKGQCTMLVTKFPLFDKEGELFALCGVDKDISDIVRTRENLVSARLKAESAEKLQEEFLANMSHEIRTPMNGIVGMTHLLSDSKLTPAQQEWVQIISYSSDSLLAIINDILDLSKIKAGRMALDETDFSIHDAINQVMIPFQVRTNAKGVSLRKKIDERLPLYVWGDQHKLVQILNNLIGNAVKFTDKGSIYLEVNVKEESDYIMVIQFNVTDTGIGIAENNLDSIFESFVQAGSDMVRRFGGTGLGLAITKRLVELQGGQISVISEEGKGSSFNFDIRYAQSDKKDSNQEKCISHYSENNFLAGKKVLIVEDNEVNQKVIKAILEKHGLQISMANNGKEAVHMLQKQTDYDLIIMDLQMPEMNGFQATTFIRNKLHLTIPIIAMTASALRNEKKNCMELGMNDYLTKPFAPTELINHLSVILHPRHDQSESLASAKVNINEIYNLKYLYEVDDAEYIKEVLQMFLDTTPRLLQEMKNAAMHEEWDSVYNKAHKLKSSLGILQIGKMLEDSSRIENFAKEKTDLDVVPELIHSLFDQFDLIEPMLIAEIAEAA